MSRFVDKKYKYLESSILSTQFSILEWRIFFPKLSNFTKRIDRESCCCYTYNHRGEYKIIKKIIILSHNMGMIYCYTCSIYAILTILLKQKPLN